MNDQENYDGSWYEAGHKLADSNMLQRDNLGWLTEWVSDCSLWCLATMIWLWKT